MLVVIFTYNREEMLSRLLTEFYNTPHDIIVIDDGSAYMKRFSNRLKVAEEPDKEINAQLIKTNHEGKKGFWRKWIIARQLALGSGHDYFLFLPDDIRDLNLQAIEELTKQGWDDLLFAVNIINCNRDQCWGYYRTGQEDIEIGDTILKEVGFVDCGFLTNRTTLDYVPIREIGEGWFDRPDKSSGVGAQMTESMRIVGTKMMMPFPGLCHYDWKHASVMHPKPVNDKPLQKKRVIKTRRRI